MPVFDYECKYCGFAKEVIVCGDRERDVGVDCESCGYPMIKIFPQKAPVFKLVFDNKRGDMCDWDGNRNRYYDKYKEMKSEGKDVRIPTLDGEN